MGTNVLGFVVVDLIQMNVKPNQQAPRPIQSISPNVRPSVPSV